MQENVEKDSVKKGAQWLEQGLNRKKKDKLDFKKWFQRDNLIVLVLSGVLLFIIALPTKSSGSKQTADSEKQQSDVTQAENSSGTNAGGQVYDGAGTEYDYALYLEQKLENVLEGVSGVGKVTVMVTLQSSEELIVEKDAPVSRSNTTETDSEGGNRIVSQVDTQETTIYRTEGSDSEPYVVKTILPKVEGVLVVAQGAGNGSIDKSITEIVQALFDVEAHKVKVVPMESGK